MTSPPEPDWPAWSREAVALMQRRNVEWISRLGLDHAPYQWNLQKAVITFTSARGPVEASLCVVGSVSHTEGTFLWSWANDAIPPQAKAGIERVRKFGTENRLSLLTECSWRGGKPEGLEMLALAGRILGAEGAWVAPDEELTLFFALFGFRLVAGAG